MKARDNPTDLEIGATGLLDGRLLTVVGRAAFAVTVDGARYVWNEYAMKAASGEALTLVFEIEEAGPVWKRASERSPTSPTCHSTR